jgi:anti-sigma factor RsiW
MDACHDCAPLLPLADDEIADDRQRGQRDAHLATCPDCRAVRSRYAELRLATARGATRHPTPFALSGRIRSALQRADTAAPYPTAPPAPSRLRWPGLVLASGWLLSGALACALGFVVFLPAGIWHAAPGAAQGVASGGAGAGTPASPVASAVAAIPASIGTALGASIDAFVDNHARALITGHIMDVVSSDRHTVKPWFRGRIDFSPTVPDLRERGFPLIGGRLEYLRDHTLAVLVYQRRQHLIDVYVWPSPPDGAGGASPPITDAAGARGFHAVQGGGGGMRFVAVADLDRTELHAFGDTLRAALSGPAPAAGAPQPPG